MEYTKVTFRLKDTEDFASDLLAATLGEIGFESFEETTQGINCYCPTALFDEAEMNTTLNELPIALDFAYRVEKIADQNWNETWEQNSFKSIEVNEHCLIHNVQSQPEKPYKYDITIAPKQAFGSGSHETTRLIINYLINENISGKTVLDMGCGTGILSIFAAMRGARKITAIDIDEWSTRNTEENIRLNNLSNIEVKLGSAELLGDEKFDIILANINRNILLEHLPIYSNVINPHGTLIISGFYSSDAPILIAKAIENGFQKTAEKSDNDWTMLVFEKK